MSNTISKNEKGEIYLRIPHTWGILSAEMIAEDMTATDVTRLLDACGGDFSKLEANTAKAMGIKAALLLEKQEEQAKRRAECRKEKAEERHTCIMDEIRSLCGDSPCFTVTQIQLEAARQGEVVRTRQMYSRHLARAYCDGAVVHLGYSYKAVPVVYANGTNGTQRIRQKGGYKFN